ncbi:MAG: DUF3106 domain-containing protein [Verrucomicrobiota bacterium]
MRAWLNIFKIGRFVACGIFLTAIVGAFPLGAENKADAQPKPDAPSLLPPGLPIVKPPIEYFRELLSMPSEERERLLAEKSPEQKKVLQAKLKEYERMAPEERELRLGVTELRWHLVPLMSAAPAERRERLASIPEEKRALVEDRLHRWDELPVNQKKEFLDNEMAINYFLRLQPGTFEQQTNLLETFPAASREHLERELAQWRSLPAEQRERMCKRFQDFFELNLKEKKKTLSSLSELERLQMESTLNTFQNLPTEQRRYCIESFRKFARMDVSERNQFLKKAELWENMSPTDRKAWRELVQKLPQMPPLPPGLKMTPPLPPSPLIATNFSR